MPTRMRGMNARHHLRHGAHGGGGVLVKLGGLLLDGAHALEAGTAHQQQGETGHGDSQDQLQFERQFTF